MTLDMRVRIAFTTDPFDPSPAWTDVSAFVDVGSHAIDIARGAGDLDDSVNPSTLSLTFNNKDGRFTPGYTGGAYYPNVVLGKRIQVHGTTNGSVFTPRFDGYLDTLPMQWAPTGKYAEAQVTAVDRLKKLGKQLLTDNIVTKTIVESVTTTSVNTGPLEYWTMGDPADTVHPLNTGTATNGAREVLSNVAGYGAGAELIEFQSEQLLTTDGLLPVKLTTASFGGAGLGSAVAPGTEGVGVGAFIAMGATGTSVPIFLTNAVGNCLVGILLNPSGDGLVEFDVDETAGSGVNVTLTGVTKINDGLPHYVFGAYDPGAGPGFGIASLYVDGALQDQNSGLGTLSESYQVDRIGAVTVGSLRMSHATVYRGTLSNPQILAIAQAGLTGFSGETSAARFTRLAAYAGVTPVVTGTSGTQQIGPLIDINGTSILDQLQSVQDTENGAFFTQTDGDVQLVPRTAFYNQAAAWTLSAGQYGTDLTFLLDDSRLINTVSVTDATGKIQNLTLASSVTANGTYTSQRTLNTNDSNEALGWAQWQTGPAAALTARVSQVTVDLLTQQSLLTSAWALEIGNRIDLTGLPTGAPASSVQLQVAGYTESYSLTNYAMTLNTIPFITTGLFTLNDATLGKLNTGGILGY